MSAGGAPEAARGRAPAGVRGGSLLGGALLVAAAACCFGSISTLILVATRGTPARPGATLTGVLLWRYGLAALALAALAAGQEGGLWRRGGAGATATAVLVGGLGQAGVAFLSLSALRWITVGTLGFLFYTYPAWVAVLAAARGSEPLDRRKLLALALSLAGIACTIGPPGAATAGTWPGVVLALAGAVVYALYIPYLGALQARFTPTGASAFVCAGAAALFAGPALYGAGRGAPLVALPAASWLAIAVLALVCTVLAFIAFLSGLARLGPVRTAIVSTVEPFFTALLGALVLDQPAGAGTFVGGALIAGAVLLLHRRRAGAD
ncbi:hypothetical protein tb265_25960 [Gemmatimonadetes bacterium T265]|nr:hypothetical protein tb265_25960 [Gemmatimonadetes bacterium T265]